MPRWCRIGKFTHISNFGFGLERFKFLLGCFRRALITQKLLNTR